MQDEDEEDDGDAKHKDKALERSSADSVHDKDDSNQASSSHVNVAVARGHADVSGDGGALDQNHVHGMNGRHQGDHIISGNNNSVIFGAEGSKHEEQNSRDSANATQTQTHHNIMQETAQRNRRGSNGSQEEQDLSPKWKQSSFDQEQRKRNNSLANDIFNHFTELAPVQEHNGENHNAQAQTCTKVCSVCGE